MSTGSRPLHGIHRWHRKRACKPRQPLPDHAIYFFESCYYLALISNIEAVLTEVLIEALKIWKQQLLSYLFDFIRHLRYLLLSQGKYRLW